VEAWSHEHGEYDTVCHTYSVPCRNIDVGNTIPAAASLLLYFLPLTESCCPQCAIIFPSREPRKLSHNLQHVFILQRVSDATVASGYDAVLGDLIYVGLLIISVVIAGYVSVYLQLYCIFVFTVFHYMFRPT
jgi:hypothetical protein